MATTKFDPWIMDGDNNQFSNISFSDKEDVSSSRPDRLPYIGDGIGVEPGENTYIFFITLWTIVVPVVFSLIACVGIAGNMVVLIIIATTPKLRTATNKFLANLAIADIIFLSTCVPFQAHKYASWSWPFGEVCCKIIQYLLFVTVYVTVWTLVCIAGIRYVYLVKTNSRIRFLLHGMCIEICMCLWIIMFFVHVPTYISHKVNKVENYSYCGIDPDTTKEVLLSFFICAYVLPLCLICILYLLIFQHLSRQETKHQTHRNAGNRRQHSVRVSKIIIVVILCFTISWFPFHIHNIISLYHRVPQAHYYEVFRIIWHCMAYGNSLANPFIYNFISSDFQLAIQGVMHGRCKESSRTQESKHQSSGNNELVALNGEIRGSNNMTNCQSDTNCHSTHNVEETSRLEELIASKAVF